MELLDTRLPPFSKTRWLLSRPKLKRGAHREQARGTQRGDRRQADAHLPPALYGWGQ
jgi:hypothetical protein